MSENLVVLGFSLVVGLIPPAYKGGVMPFSYFLKARLGLKRSSNGSRT